MELQPGADGSQILSADALYQLGRVEEAYRLLLSIGPTSPRPPILARLALLQLHRGFLYDTNQVCRFEAAGPKMRSRGGSMFFQGGYRVCSCLIRKTIVSLSFIVKINSFMIHAMFQSVISQS